MVETHSDIRYRRLKKTLQRHPVELYENQTHIMELVQVALIYKHSFIH